MTVIRIARTAPGLVLALAIGLAAVAVTSRWLPLAPAVLVALLMGLALANTIGVPRPAVAGVGFASRTVLRLGIVLLGVRLTFHDVASVGGRVVLAVVAAMAAAFAVVTWLARRLNVGAELATLIGMGTAVCGNSAIMATSPVIRARPRDVGVAVATITLLGTIGLIVLPIVGQLAGMSERAIGVWLGLAIHDTGQVVAAAAMVSSETLETATVVKLLRNTLLAPLLVFVAWKANATGASRDPSVRRGVVRAVPLFVVGFVAVVALRSAGLIDDRAAAVLGDVSMLCIVTAVAALGWSTRFATFRGLGARPLVVAVTAAVVLAAVAFALAGFVS